MNTLICYKKCTTCKGVEKIMKDQGLAYDLREIDKENPSIEELKALEGEVRPTAKEVLQY